MHRRTLIASHCRAAPSRWPRAAPAVAQTDRSGEHDLPGSEAGPGGDPAAAGRRADACRADQDAGAAGFYDGTPFHRVIEGFMAQGGDPTGTGTGGSKLPNLPPEFSQRHFVRGVCGMARAADPDSANSQFFIMFAPAPSLDGKYTIWGQVMRGMEYVDQIKRGSRR